MSAPERLVPILAAVAERSRVRRAALPIEALRRDVTPAPERRRAFLDALSQPGLSFIAECKRKAPSTGQLSEEVDLTARIRAYAEGGARALSILTEEDHFQGSLADLGAAPEVTLPRIRKDFVLDEGMLLEAQLAGASAVLLLACCLDDVQLGELRAQARELGLAVLLEVHDEAELERAVPLAPEALGVNARDLRTFEIDLAVTERLLPRVPDGMLRVAESGLHDLDDLARVARAGADAALVGTALMRSADPAATLRSWSAALLEQEEPRG